MYKILKNLVILNLTVSKYSTSDLRIISIVIALIPVSLITGPAIPDILLSLVGLYFIVISLNKKLFSFYLNYFFLISITFICTGFNLVSLETVILFIKSFGL